MKKILKFLIHPPTWWTTIWFWISVVSVVVNAVILFAASKAPGYEGLVKLSAINLVMNLAGALFMYYQSEKK